MIDPILDKMKKGVYYPGHHLGEREELAELVAKGHIERMDASFLCGPDSEPAYCLTASGCRLKRAKTRKAPHSGAER
jgi:hypothetical protein